MAEAKDTALEIQEQCFYCLGSGYHFIGSINEDGEEIVEAYACRHCQGMVARVALR
jgi:hypothetical protein